MTFINKTNNNINNKANNKKLNGQQSYKTLSNNNSKSHIYFDNTTILKNSLLKAKESNDILSKKVNALSNKLNEVTLEKDYYQSTLNNYRKRENLSIDSEENEDSYEDLYKDIVKMQNEDIENLKKK